MRHLVLLIASGACALALGGVAGAAPGATEGVHGGGTIEFVQGSARISLSTTRLPSGEIIGHINDFVVGTPSIEKAVLQARADFLEINRSSACVSGEITRFSGWPFDDPPTRLTVNIVAGEMTDNLGVAWSIVPVPDLSHLCERLPPQWAVEKGNFRIVGR